MIIRGLIILLMVASAVGVGSAGERPVLRVTRADDEVFLAPFLRQDTLLFVTAPDVPDDLVLQVSRGMPQRLSVTWTAPDGEQITRRSGRVTPLRERDFATGVAMVRLPSTHGDTLALQITIDEGALPETSVMSQAEWYRRLSTKQLIRSILYGAFAYALLMSIVFVVALRRRAYVFYAAYLLCYLIGMILPDGRPALSWVDDVLPVPNAMFYSILSISFAILFSRSFLEVPQRRPRWAMTMNVLAAFYGVFSVIDLVRPVGMHDAILSLQLPSMAIVSGVLLWTGLDAWRSGMRSASWYTIGWGTLLTSILLLSVLRLPTVYDPHIAWIRWAVDGWQLMHLGAAIEVFVLTIGVAMQIREQARADDMLRAIVPASIVERMKRGEHRIADTVDSCSVIFCDIVGFTPVAAATRADVLVETLERLFRSFDECAQRHGIEKIKTIGDAYLAVAGVPDRRADHAQAAVAFAQDLLHASAQIRFPDGSPITIRIGIHTGSIVAGVLDTWKSTYDLWGDTVNVASRLESTAAPGEIHVSEAVVTALNGSVPVEIRGRTTLKGLGEVVTYRICAR